MTHTHSVAEAFSKKSAVYDAFGENHINLDRMRQRVYSAVARHAPPGGRLLEINAGTGLDAAQLVRRGFTVHATDLSAGMVAAIETKIETQAAELDDRLSVQQLSFTQLDQVKNGPFDGVYSNFGGLNCVADLRPVTRHLSQILAPGGIVVWVIMPPVCPWEIALFAKDWRVATRRFRTNGVMANVEGVQFRTWYFTPSHVMRAFGPAFTCVGLEGLSVVTPSADNKTFALKHPNLFNRLVQIDEAVSPFWPFNRMGDFFILTMKKIDAPDGSHA